VGYVVPRAKESISFEELRVYLKNKLPDYMVPSYFVQLDSLPLTPNGKVDKRALPVPDRSYEAREEGYVAPNTPMEKDLAEIWQEVLGVERVSVHDNFFDLGGHSLMSMEVVAKLENKIGLRINPIELMLQNLGQVAAVCENQIEKRQKTKLQKKKVNILSVLKKMVTGRK
jgi:acyl carrier protein